MVTTIKKYKKKKVVLKNKDTFSQDCTGTLREAVAIHQSGDLSGAELMYRKILSVEPDHADALHLLGVIAYQTGQQIAAIDLIRKAIHIQPVMPHYHNNLGNAFMSSGKTGDAIKCFSEAVRIKPDYVEALNNMGNALKRLGETDNALAYYTKAVELDPDYMPVINNLANLLKDLGRAQEALAYYKKAESINPGSAVICFNLGNALKDLNRLDDAIQQYDKAISMQPDFAEAYSNLANVFKKIKRYPEAVAHYKKAIRLKPDFAEAYNNLADAYSLMGRFGEAVENCQKAIHIKPDSESAYVNLGNIYLAGGEFSASIEQYRKAVEINSEYSDAHFNLGLVLLMKGEFSEGWKEYGWRFKNKEVAAQIGYREVGVPEWDGTPIKDVTILVKSEQGLGDQIQFVRYVSLLRKMGCRVVFECHTELMSLFKSYKGIDRLLEKPYSSASGEHPDVCVQLLNLPVIYGTNLDTIVSDVPYLKAAREYVDVWKSRFDNSQFNIGIVWAGNPDHSNDRNRSCALKDFGVLSAVPGIALYSLQKGGLSSNGLSLPSGLRITDLGKDLRDFSDTAAVIECLDLVITVDTAVAHLAGALAKRVWTLLPYIPDWRWMLDRSDTPWYPSMTLFRQSENRRWENVMQSVSEELKEIVKESKATK